VICVVCLFVGSIFFQILWNSTVVVESLGEVKTGVRG
jgi:hypothetical protein